MPNDCYSGILQENLKLFHASLNLNARMVIYCYDTLPDGFCDIAEFLGPFLGARRDVTTLPMSEILS